MKELVHVNYENLIFEIRGVKVMVDADLAALYDTETKKLKQAVRRNIDRFPEDFMFELVKEEKKTLVKTFTRLSSMKYSSVNPMVFTEQGVAMLSSVINSDRAIKINIEIMRAFSRYRTLLMENQELREEIMAVDDKLNQAFRILLDKIDKLTPNYTDRKLIGFKRNED